MADIDLLVQLKKELLNDSNPPAMDLAFDPYDLVAVELIFVQAEALVEEHVGHYREKYRPQFDDPGLFDNFVAEHKRKIHERIRHMVDNARQQLRQLGYDFEEFDSSENDPVN
jgi:hypothetical protein